MKPSIERELEAIRQMIRDLENRLKNESVPLGHRVIFDVGRKGEVPAPTALDRAEGRVLGTEGWVVQTTGSGGGGAGTPDGHTLAVVTGVLNAEPLSGSVDGHFNALSGTINAGFVNLSGTVDGHFNALSGTINARVVNLSGTIDGHFNALSGTINATLQAVFSASQVWSQTTNGTEGTTMTAVIPVPYAGPQYYAFITNSTGSTSPVYRIQNKNSASFQVVSTAPFSNGDRIDFLTISGGLGPVWDGSVIASLSGTIDARFFNLSGTIDGEFRDLSGTVDGHFNALSGTIAADLNTRGFSTWAKPLHPHPFDDEFENTTLDSSWITRSASGSFVAGIDPYDSTFSAGATRMEIHTDRRPSWVMFQPPSNNATQAMYKTGSLYIPTGDFFIWTRCAFNFRLSVTPVNNDHNIGITMGSLRAGPDIDFNNRVAMSLNESDAGVVQAEFAKLESGGATNVGLGFDYFATQAETMPVEAIGIQKIGTTYHAWVFGSNLGAIHFGSTTWTGSLQYIALVFQNAGASTAPAPMILGYDFVRIVTGSTFLP